jgi:hypothetical protein
MILLSTNVEPRSHTTVEASTALCRDSCTLFGKVSNVGPILRGDRKLQAYETKNIHLSNWTWGDEIQVRERVHRSSVNYPVKVKHDF